MASHAYTTTPLLRPEVSEPIGLLCAGPRQLGPVTLAIQAMRQAISDRITADIALLDALDGDTDFELEPLEEQHDAENVDWRMLGGQAA